MTNTLQLQWGHRQLHLRCCALGHDSLPMYYIEFVNKFFFFFFFSSITSLSPFISASDNKVLDTRHRLRQLTKNIFFHIQIYPYKNWLIRELLYQLIVIPTNTLFLYLSFCRGQTVFQRVAFPWHQQHTNIHFCEAIGSQWVSDYHHYHHHHRHHQHLMILIRGWMEKGEKASIITSAVVTQRRHQVLQLHTPKAGKE